MATLEIKGITGLIDKMDVMNQAPEKVKKQLVNEGGKVVLDQLKADAPKGDGNSYKKLSIVDGRSGKGYLYIDIGINHKNWDQCRGLYFQNYEGERSNGKHLQWLNKSFSRSKRQARNIIRNGMLRAIKID